jgi:hypothetical protein
VQCISKEDGEGYNNNKKRKEHQDLPNSAKKGIMNNGKTQWIVAGRLEPLNGGIFTGI